MSTVIKIINGHFNQQTCQNFRLINPPLFSDYNLASIMYTMLDPIEAGNRFTI